MTRSTGELFNAASWLLGRNAAATPDRVAVTAIDLDGAATDVTYAELDDLAWQAAAALVAADVRAEERILLCMADTPELLALFLGALYIGAPTGYAAMLAAGLPGSLYVMGDSVATGYWCRSAVSRRVFRGEWLRTSEIYARGADGYYTCLGRIDDVMKAGGQWVSPGEVEARLRAHPGVEQVVVVAVPDSDGLDKPVACVVAKAGAAPAEDELIAFCRAGLASYKRPRHVLFLPGFPLTATGKVQRYRLREHAVAKLAGAAARAAAEPAVRQGEPA